MIKEKIYIFDTTLRDGAQTEGVNFSIEDKNKIAKVLTDIGVDYVEGGWPGANPVDTKFFSNPPKMNRTLFTAFGMTKKTGRSVDNDPGIASLLNANTQNTQNDIHGNCEPQGTSLNRSCFFTFLSLSSFCNLIL